MQVNIRMYIVFYITNILFHIDNNIRQLFSLQQLHTLIYHNLRKCSFCLEYFNGMK